MGNGLANKTNKTGYVLDSGGYYTLCLGRFQFAGGFSDDSVIRLMVRPLRLLRQTIKKLAATGRFAAVESKRELVEVVLEVLVADRALMSPHEPPFQEGEDTVHTRQQIGGRLLL